MKKLPFTLLVVSFLFCLNLLAQSGIQTPTASFASISGHDITLSRSFFIGRSSGDTIPKASVSSLDLDDRNYFLRKSKRQKRTGWILLGTGVALIGTGIIVASSQNDDVIASAISVVFISGPGVLTSLISIPFFTASARNKRKANSFISSVELLQSPGLAQAGLASRVYPALSVRMVF